MEKDGDIPAAATFYYHLIMVIIDQVTFWVFGGKQLLEVLCSVACPALPFFLPPFCSESGLGYLFSNPASVCLELPIHCGVAAGTASSAGDAEVPHRALGTGSHSFCLTCTIWTCPMRTIRPLSHRKTYATLKILKAILDIVGDSARHLTAVKCHIWRANLRRDLVGAVLLRTNLAVPTPHMPEESFPTRSARGYGNRLTSTGIRHSDTDSTPRIRSVCILK